MSEELLSPLTSCTPLSCVSGSDYIGLRPDQIHLCDCTNFTKTRHLPSLVPEHPNTISSRIRLCYLHKLNR